MPYSALKQSVSFSSTSSLQKQPSYFWNLCRGKYDVYRSIFISRKVLSAIRVFFAIYFLIILFFIVAKCEDLYTLLQISRWVYAVQTIYFIQAAHQSLKGKPAHGEEETDWKITHVLYEISFSFQLFNFLYYWIELFPSYSNWNSNLIECMIEFHLNVVAIVVIWCDQLFNLMRLYKSHIWFIILVASVNLGYLCLFYNGSQNLIYKNLNFQDLRDIGISLLMIIVPIGHFFVGYKHSEYKRKTKNNKRKHLNEHLISLRKVSQ